MKRVVILVLIAVCCLGIVPIHAQGGLVATVNVETLNVRRAPRISSSRKGQLHQGDQVTLVGRTADGSWVEAQTPFGIGWLDRSWLKYDGTITVLPVVDVVPPFATTFNGEDGTYIRLGPDGKYPVIGRLTDGTEADIVAIFDKPRWYEISLTNGVTGWVSGAAVEVTGDLSVLPPQDAQPVAMINTYNLHVHVAPDVNSPIIGDVRLDNTYAIIGRDFRGNWWQIQGKFGTGWVWANFTNAIGNTLNVPVTDGSPAGVPILQ